MNIPSSQYTPMLAAVAAALVLLQGCAVNPVSGQREFVLVSESQEIAMGADGAESVARSIGVVDDAALQSYVQGLGKKLAADSERPDLPWSFSDAAAGGLSLLFLSYGRDAERQADDLGFQYALSHGYDVCEMVNVFASLQHAGQLDGASPLPAWAGCVSAPTPPTNGKFQ